MATVSINAKMPIELAIQLDEEKKLTPDYLGGWLFANAHQGKLKPASGLCYTYTFKIDENIHSMIKERAAREGLAMNELICRLLAANHG